MSKKCHRCCSGIDQPWPVVGTRRKPNGAINLVSQDTEGATYISEEQIGRGGWSGKHVKRCLYRSHQVELYRKKSERPRSRDS